MQVSIVIVNYNVAQFLYQCLTSVEAALRHISGEIIVVDNASSDDSCHLVKRFFPNVHLIENKLNVGFSKANNQGVQIAKGKYVLILNPDTVIPEDILIKLFEFANTNAQYGAIGVPLYDGNGQYLPESKRNLPTPWVALKKMFGKTSSYYANHLEKHISGEVAVLVGAFMWIEKSKYKKVGGFDEDYFMYGEDIDLSYKLLKKGYKNYYYSLSQVIHYKGESTLKDNLYLNNFYGAMHLFYQKHYKTNIVIDVIMQLGIRFWHQLNKIKINTENVSFENEPKNILYIGSDNEILNLLSNLYKESNIHVFAVCETRVISRFDDLEKINDTIIEKGITDIIFDNTSNSYSKIIFLMLHIKGVNFMIHPSKSNFIIGSFNRNCQGKYYFLKP